MKKKRRYEKNEAEKIVGIAFNLKGEHYSKEELDKMNRSELSSKNIMKESEKFKTDEQKNKTKKTTLKKKKETRKRKKSTLYSMYFIIWGLIISVLVIPFFIADTGILSSVFDDGGSEQDIDSGENEDSSEQGDPFGMLWLVVMIGMSIVGLITGMFIAELEGILWGFFIGAAVGLVFYFVLRYWSLGRIISAGVLTLLAVLLFFIVFKPRFEKMVKRK